MNHRKAKINLEIIFTDLDGKEGILIDVRRVKYYILNGTAWRLWICLAKGMPLGQIIKEMEKRYGRLSPNFKKNIHTTIRKIVRLKLIKLTT